MQTKHLFVTGPASELRVKFRASRSGLSPRVVFQQTVSRWFLGCSFSLCVYGFICGVCFLVIWSIYTCIISDPSGRGRVSLFGAFPGCLRMFVL